MTTMLGTMHLLRELIRGAPCIEQELDLKGKPLEEVWQWLMEKPEAQSAGNLVTLALVGALFVRLGWTIEIVAQAYDREKTLEHVFLRVLERDRSIGFDLCGWKPPKEKVTAEVSLLV